MTMQPHAPSALLEQQPGAALADGARRRLVRALKQERKLEQLAAREAARAAASSRRAARRAQLA